MTTPDWLTSALDLSPFYSNIACMYVGLLRVLGALTFFMSAILDNLTTTIVMVSLVKKVLTNPMDRKLFGAMIVIAGSCSLPFEHANIGAMHVHTYIHT